MRNELENAVVFRFEGVAALSADEPLLRVADPGVDRLHFCHGRLSRAEHPRFLSEILRAWPRTRIRDVRQAPGGDDLVVTGEHGDQLFGSAKALDLSWSELAAPWPDAFPRELGRRLASAYRVDVVLDWLAPQIERAPASVRSLWDLLWWLNFSLKWQSVSLRVPVRIGRFGERVPGGRRGALGQLALTEHFFRTDAFQRWALAHRDASVRAGDWTSYKWPLKEALHRLDGDDDYLASKTRQPSLGDVMRGPRRERCLALVADGRAFRQPIDGWLRGALPGHEGGDAGFEAELEATLWSDLTGSDE